MSSADDYGRDPATTRLGIRRLNEVAQRHGKWVPTLRAEVAKAVAGQTEFVEQLLIAMLADGHVLVEGELGLGHVLAFKALAGSTNADFRRIQFTPETQSSDLVGHEALADPESASPDVRTGPLFANFMLADSIHRARIEIQAELLGGLQRRQISVGERHYPLEDPFLLMATQNLVEDLGAGPLSTTQADGFLIRVMAGDSDSTGASGPMGLGTPLRAPTTVVSTDDLLVARIAVASTYMDRTVSSYIVSLIHATREPEVHGPDLARYIEHGASPRATLSLVAASRAVAFLAARGHVTQDDVSAIAIGVMAHRIGLKPVAHTEGISSKDVVQMILDAMPAP